MKSICNFRARRFLLSLALSLAALEPAAAQTVANGTAILGNLPTCKTMLQNCILFAQRARMAAGPGGVIPANITAFACYDMSRKAQATGSWPDNQPFGFAMSCTTDNEQYRGKFRHHVFHDQNGDANARMIEDPANLPATPPVAGDAKNNAAN